jgi:hypothetical protein
MTIKANPEEYEVDEFANFNLTVTITDETTSTTPGVSVDGDTTTTTTSPVNISYVNTGDSGVSAAFSANTFTLSGRFVEAFSRVLRYLDTENNSVTVNAFTDLPADFNALYSYIAPSARTTTKLIEVGLESGGTYSFPVTVSNNWGYANAELAKNVAKGRY